MIFDPTALRDDPSVTLAHDRECVALALHDDPDNRHAVLCVPEGVPVEWWTLALADCDERPVTLMGHPLRGDLDVWDDTDAAQACPPASWWVQALAMLPAGTFLYAENLPDYWPYAT